MNKTHTQTIYFDLDDHYADGNGWNIVDNGAFALRFPTCAACLDWCDRNGFAYEVVDRLDMDAWGECDCGATYMAASRTDHDADTGQCWDCSDRSMETMTAREWFTYINGADAPFSEGDGCPECPDTIVVDDDGPQCLSCGWTPNVGRVAGDL